MARFFLDESLPPQLAEHLRGQGHEASAATEQGMAGAPDPAVYEKACELGAILITLDLDFADVRRFQGGASIIVMRPRGPISRAELVEFAVTRIVRYRAEIEELRDANMILEPRRSRIRRKN